MTFSPTEPRSFHRFLDKFRILDRLHWTEELVDESVKAVSDALIRDGVDYAWMRLSVSKYLDHIGWHRREAIKFIHDAFQRYAPGRVGLVISIKYESERASQRKYVNLVDSPEVFDSIAGIDLVGNEEFFDANFYAPIYNAWGKAGKRLFAHVGESQHAENILAAIKKMGVTEVSHGVRLFWDGHDLAKDIITIAIERDVCFHMAITSNFITGVVTGTHPIGRFLLSGLKVTIGTDDPVVCGTSLEQEYRLAAEQFRFADLACADWIPKLRKNAAERVAG